MSGGQKQMLAIAPKASLRNPPVLISQFIAVHLVVGLISCHTDEATSALNTTSRILVFEALQHWRTDNTIIAIPLYLCPQQECVCGRAKVPVRSRGQIRIGIRWHGRSAVQGDARGMMHDWSSWGSCLSPPLTQHKGWI